MKNRILSFLAFLGFFVGSACGANAPKYIFYFIGDGMGNGHMISAYQYNRMVRQMEEPLLFTTFPVVSLCTTWSASSPVTDSAAAGTALATSTKTLNGMLGMSADSVAVTSVADVLHNNGYGVGIITSVAADDATPGAFYAHQPSRKNYYEIGIEAAKCGFELIGGSGLRGLVDKEGKATDLMETFSRNNVAVVRGTGAVRDVDNRRVVILNNDTVVNWTLGFTIDSIGTGMTLVDMTRDGLYHLQRVSPDSFFMMVEGGNIDYAGHANDGGAVIKEVLKFDESLRVAYDFYLQHPDETLIVVTADHETGGMSLGNQYLHYNANLHYVDAQRISKDQMADEMKALIKSRRVYTWDDMKEYLEEKLGFWTIIPLTERETEMLHQSFTDTFESQSGREQVALYNKYPQFVVDVFSILNDYIGIGWTTINHTGTSVPVYAIGVGAQEFSGLMDNVEIPATILRVCGLK